MKRNTVATKKYESARYVFNGVGTSGIPVLYIIANMTISALNRNHMAYGLHPLAKNRLGPPKILAAPILMFLRNTCW